MKAEEHKIAPNSLSSAAAAIAAVEDLTEPAARDKSRSPARMQGKGATSKGPNDVAADPSGIGTDKLDAFERLLIMQQEQTTDILQQQATMFMSFLQEFRRDSMTRPDVQPAVHNEQHIHHVQQVQVHLVWALHRRLLGISFPRC